MKKVFVSSKQGGAAPQQVPGAFALGVGLQRIVGQKAVTAQHAREVFA